jgi:hypothetical protein
MTGSSGCELAHLDAAYVLGALSPEERLELERHLPGCPACTRAVGQLAGMPGLLAAVSPEVLRSEPEPVPETLLPALVREVRRERVRRRWLAGAVAAAVVLVVGAGAVAVVQSIDEGRAPSSSATELPTAPAADMRPVGQDIVTASVSLTSVGWGTRLDLTCSYDGPAHEYDGESAPTYALVIRSVDGGVEQVASWSALPGKTLTLEGATSWLRDDIVSVEVRSADGRPVLELNG